MAIAPNYTFPPTPYPIFGQYSRVNFDGVGTAYLAAVTNGSPLGGVYVWKNSPGGLGEPVLAPGDDAARFLVGLDVFPDGNLYLLAIGADNSRVRWWRVPGAVQRIVQPGTGVPATGPVGPQGAPGPSGKDGSRGPQGQQGPPGATPSDAHIAEIAWAKARDYVMTWWNANMDYGDGAKAVRNFAWDYTIRVLRKKGLIGPNDGPENGESTWRM